MAAPLDAQSHILLSGGTGFFGRALLRHWLAAAQAGLPAPAVTVLARAPQRFLQQFPEFAGAPWLRFHQADILQPQTLPVGAAFTHVLHAATESTIGPQLPALARFGQIVDGTRNLLELALRCGAGRFLLTSSGAVYGPQPAGLAAFDESWLGAPDPLLEASAYGMGKRCAEHLCALYSREHGLETVVARCFAFVGPDLPVDVHFAIGNFIRDAVQAEAITVKGDGTAMRSYMDQADLAQWLTVLLGQGRNGQAYNVGAPEALSMAALAARVRDVVAPGKAVHVLGTPVANRPVHRYIPDVGKAQRELGLHNTVPLDTAIAHSAQALRGAGRKG